MPKPTTEFQPPKFEKVLFSKNIGSEERPRVISMRCVMWATQDKYAFDIREQYKKDGDMHFGRGFSMPVEFATALFEYIQSNPNILAKYAKGKGKAQLAFESDAE